MLQAYAVTMKDKIMASETVNSQVLIGDLVRYTQCTLQLN